MVPVAVEWFPLWIVSMATEQMEQIFWATPTAQSAVGEPATHVPTQAEVPRLGTNPVCNAVPCFLPDNIVGNWLCDERKKSALLIVCHEPESIL